MMNRANERTATTRMRRDQQPQAHTDDSYRSPLRMRSGTECSKCGATYENGRWTWQASADKTRQIVCPACRRILDQVPAGELVLAGDYLAPRHDEVLGLLRNEAAGEAQQHPLERIMAVDAQPDHVTVHHRAAPRAQTGRGAPEGSPGRTHDQLRRRRRAAAWALDAQRRQVAGRGPVSA